MGPSRYSIGGRVSQSPLLLIGKVINVINNNYHNHTWDFDARMAQKEGLNNLHFQQ